MTVPRMPAANAAKSSGRGASRGAIRARAIVRFLSVGSEVGTRYRRRPDALPHRGDTMLARVAVIARTHVDAHATYDDVGACGTQAAAVSNSPTAAQSSATRSRCPGS